MSCSAASVTEAEQNWDIELGPFFTAGVLVLAYGLLRRRKFAVAAGLAAIWVDQRTEIGRDLKRRIRSKMKEQIKAHGRNRSSTADTDTDCQASRSSAAASSRQSWLRACAALGRVRPVKGLQVRPSGDSVDSNGGNPIARSREGSRSISTGCGGKGSPSWCVLLTRRDLMLLNATKTRKTRRFASTSACTDHARMVILGMR